MDPAVTTDHRSLITEIQVGRMGSSAGTQVFPGFTPSALGAIRAG